MRDTNLVNALREHADLVEALTGDSGWRHMRPQVDSSDFPTQWMPSELECSIFDAQVKEIIKLRGQNEQLREAAALVTKESAELLERRWIPVTERLPELQSWGASEVVLGLIKSENAPSLNKLHNLTLCVYCDNGIWSMPGRYVAITHWMPLPEPPEG